MTALALMIRPVTEVGVYLANGQEFGPIPRILRKAARTALSAALRASDPASAILATGRFLAATSGSVPVTRKIGRRFVVDC